MSGTVTETGQHTVRVACADGTEVAVQLSGTPFASLLTTAQKGDTLNLIGGSCHRGTLRPEIVVLEPDMLVDVTSLCACLRPYGFHALNSLLSRYESRATTWQIQLGNMANDFFDSCIHEHEPKDLSEDDTHDLFLKSVQRSFHASPLTYTAIDGIDKFFFHEAEQQFRNIRQTVRRTLPQLGIDMRDIMLEPQFLAPQLGLQGRMDALASNAIIELKSGKADEFRGGKSKDEHQLQMILYKEMLGSDIPLILFYSRYPRLQKVEYTMLQLQQAIAVRNDIVVLERDTRLGRLPQIMAALRESDFNTQGECGKLYCNYLRPVITRFIARVQSMPPVIAAYFHAFARFIANEQYASKRQYATLWNTPVAAQQAEGCAVAGLHLHPIKDIDGCVVELRAETYDDLSAINFRRGDSVTLYEQDCERYRLFRCQITGIGQHELHLSLSFKQHSESVFSLDRPYAIAPAYTEATYTQACRGLTAIVEGKQARRDLLLGITAPIELAPEKLAEHQPATPTSYLTALRSLPYFLLIGPPGTGKTNQHLRSMVRDALSRGETLLLMAYTNQAVDEICGVLADECHEGYARIGNENSCAAPYRQRMLSRIVDKACNRREMQLAIDSLQVIVGTIASIATKPELFALKRFDLTIVDEASQVLEPQILPILMQVGRFVLIGDHKQLPAVVQQERSESETNDPLLHEIGLTNCANSYFERLCKLQQRWGIAHITTTTLHRQGRMHEELMSFVNRRFYGGILDTVPLPHQTGPLPTGMARRIFIDSSSNEAGSRNNGNNIKCNLHEARLVADVIAQLHEAYKGCKRVLRPADIGVIVPFRAQITAIRNAIATINDGKLAAFAQSMTIDTVERYQGSQRDIIIYNTVITQAQQIELISTPVAVDDGTTVDRKLNVALTRAREQIIVVGHRPTLLRSEIYAELVFEFLSF